jgi:hypothetical protein
MEQGLITLYASRLHYEAIASAIGAFSNFLYNLSADNTIPSYHLTGTITGRTWIGIGPVQIADSSSLTLLIIGSYSSLILRTYVLPKLDLT